MDYKEIKQVLFNVDKAVQEYWLKKHSGSCHWVIEDDSHFSLFNDDDFETVEMEDILSMMKHKYSSYSKLKKNIPTKKAEKKTSSDDMAVTPKAKVSDLLAGRDPSLSDDEDDEAEDDETSSEESIEKIKRADKTFFEKEAKTIAEIFGCDDEEDDEQTETEDVNEEDDDGSRLVDDLLSDVEVEEDPFDEEIDSSDEISPLFRSLCSDDEDPSEEDDAINENFDEKLNTDNEKDVESDIMKEKEIFDVVADVLKSNLDSTFDEEITMETTIESLGLTRFDLGMALVEIEMEYGIDFDNAPEISTVHDIVNYILHH